MQSARCAGVQIEVNCGFYFPHRYAASADSRSRGCQIGCQNSALKKSSRPTLPCAPHSNGIVSVRVFRSQLSLVRMNKPDSLSHRRGLFGPLSPRFTISANPRRSRKPPCCCGPDAHRLLECLEVSRLLRFSRGFQSSRRVARRRPTARLIARENSETETPALSTIEDRTPCVRVGEPTAGV